MEKENQNVESNETTKGVVTEETGITDTQPVENKNVEGKSFKVFETEEDYQKAVDGILKAKLPSKEEMKEFKDWKDSKKTEEEKKQDEVKEKIKLQGENQNLKNEMAVMKKGVKDKQLKYVLFEVSLLDGDFDDNLDNFLKENPEVLNSYSEEKSNVSTGMPTRRETEPKVDGVTARLKEKHPNLFK